MSSGAATSTLHALGKAVRAAGLHETVDRIAPMSGGCIHTVFEVTLSNGTALVAKTNSSRCKPMFDEEALGLHAIADTRTVTVPQPLACIDDSGIAVLLMTRIASPVIREVKNAMRQFGDDLAAMHAAHAGDRYGFHCDNHIGSTPQPNQWCDDWVEFNATHRLGFQVNRAGRAGFLDSKECARCDRLIQKLDEFIPRKPKPSLLHGDLWSGNALLTSTLRDATELSTYAVIDPSCSIGDRWADVAMMKLFGGFDPACFDAYEDRSGRAEQCDHRIAVYQLYHLLNHVNIFGRGYVDQAMNVVQQLRF
jgi:fructosamine-3-kinase